MKLMKLYTLEIPNGSAPEQRDLDSIMWISALMGYTAFYVPLLKIPLT